MLSFLTSKPGFEESNKITKKIGHRVGVTLIEYKRELQKNIPPLPVFERSVNLGYGQTCNEVYLREEEELEKRILTYGDSVQRIRASLWECQAF